MQAMDPMQAKGDQEFVAALLARPALPLEEKRRRVLYWRLRVTVPLALRAEMEARRPGVTPWDGRWFTVPATEEGVSVSVATFATKQDASEAGRRFLLASHDTYITRPPAEDARFNRRVIHDIYARAVMIRHRPFAERHLTGYRVDVVQPDGCRYRVMSATAPAMSWRADGDGLADVLFLSRRRGADRGTLFRGKRGKELAQSSADRWLKAGNRSVHLMAVYRRGPDPSPVAPEVAAQNRAVACENRKRFVSHKAAFAASMNARRRNGVFLEVHGCGVCGGWHVARQRNQVSA